MASRGSAFPEGFTKGQEQLGSSQCVGGALQSGEERVLASSVGKGSPLAPLTVSIRVVVPGVPRMSEKMAEAISERGRTNCQESNCGGRGNLSVK